MVSKPAVEWAEWRENAAAEHLVASKDTGKVDCLGIYTAAVMAALLALCVAAVKETNWDLL